MTLAGRNNSGSLFLRLIVLIQLTFAGVIIQPAEALPFKKNCASMQAFLNAQTNWDNNTRPKFEGFEKAELVSVENYTRCPGGYITTKTPMGTTVCTGYMTYYTDGSFSWGAIEKFPSPIACRYR